MLLIGIAYVFLILNLVRWIIGKMRLKSYPVGEMSVKRLVIIGGEAETERVSRLLPMMSLRQELVGCVHPDMEFRPDKGSAFVGNLSQIQEIIEIYNVNEILFCGKDISTTDIMTVMSRLEDFPLEYKIAPPESLYIIGSRSIHVEGDVYTLSANSIGKKENRRRKRLFDVCSSMALLLLSPLLVWFVPGKSDFYRNLFQVLSGRRSWVGYAPQPESGSGTLPPLRDGVYHTVSAVRQLVTPEMAMRANSLYAKDYSTYTDFRIVLRMLFRRN